MTLCLLPTICYQHFQHMFFNFVVFLRNWTHGWLALVQWLSEANAILFSACLTISSVFSDTLWACLQDLRLLSLLFFWLTTLFTKPIRAKHSKILKQLYKHCYTSCAAGWHSVFTAAERGRFLMYESEGYSEVECTKKTQDCLDLERLFLTAFVIVTILAKSRFPAVSSHRCILFWVVLKICTGCFLKF